MKEKTTKTLENIAECMVGIGITTIGMPVIVGGLYLIVSGIVGQDFNSFSDPEQTAKYFELGTRIAAGIGGTIATLGGGVLAGVGLNKMEKAWYNLFHKNY